MGRVSQSRDSGEGGATVTLQDGLVFEWLGGPSVGRARCDGRLRGGSAAWNR